MTSGPKFRGMVETPLRRGVVPSSMGWFPAGHRGSLRPMWGKWLVVGGMLVQALGIAVVARGAGLSALVVGRVLLGVVTAMVCPTILDSVGDLAHRSWRTSAVGYLPLLARPRLRRGCTLRWARRGRARCRARGGVGGPRHAALGWRRDRWVRWVRCREVAGRQARRGCTSGCARGAPLVCRREAERVPVASTARCPLSRTVCSAVSPARRARACLQGAGKRTPSSVAPSGVP